MTFNYKNILTGTGLAALLGALAFGTSSCDKEFLELNDPTRVPTTESYQDSLSILNGVTAAYSSLQDLYGRSGGSRGWFVFAEIPSDNSYTVTSGERLNEFNDFTLVSDNQHVQSYWLSTYRAIARCNIVLSRAGGVKLTEATRNRYYGEVRFIRALTYFNAVRIWGDIPLVTQEIESIPDAYQFGRKPTAEVYAQIIADLEFAENNLPVTQTGNNLGRATKGAATALLGKVYLTQKRYQDAANKLQALATGTTYSLQATYANIFATNNELNNEIIFAARYTKGTLGLGSAFTTWFMPAYSTAQSTALLGAAFTGQQFNTVDPDLIAAFTASGSTDVRAATSYVLPAGAATTLGYYTKKYIDTPTSATDAENDWIVLRHADVLLMYAEAVNEQSGPTAPALTAINQVIRRSRNLPVNTANATVDLPASISKEALRSRIELERRLELSFEGHRWFDLVRTDRAIPVMNAFFARNNSSIRIDQNDLLFPIPVQEIQTNPILSQNPGY
ncbi:RagB/SusD family nutrient uptake outer membrane protein [Hymenobacter sp. 15J16-1T3B]|uniref:RagB/SusD family nutrient uptake outer membrane protein n=1 Tax=Hymenobacter sp. 15J16-1T3B TaxID=2886941 RepID=UPI001D0FC54D|nr:RagB/SusD family nutrient uptake outer membrane protein [Hymenobacter sp. 15J16-1T3B]MCC3156671.1 RagB/SusD family nutrient uptake outer membrane protein [Hymenobacter sp. 15J16-1T3B]